jgi:DNA-binding GntR family transcriptional regulator
MAELMGNHVLAQMLDDLISRCALITLMYQSTSAAEHSQRRACRHHRRPLLNRDETHGRGH